MFSYIFVFSFSFSSLFCLLFSGVVFFSLFSYLFCVIILFLLPFPSFFIQNPEHLLVFAAGNRGDDMSGCSVVSPALGKNALAVGSSMSGPNRLTTGSMDDISGFSSKGPTSDRRIKPDILAPGHFVSAVRRRFRKALLFCFYRSRFEVGEAGGGRFGALLF